MKGIRFLPINSVSDVKESFDFLRKCVFQTCATECSFSLPMHEIYQTMMQNLEDKTPFQYFAEYDKQVVGCIVGAKINDYELFLPVISVDSKFRGMGIAKKLMATLSKGAKKAGLKQYKIDGDIINPVFFIKEGFSAYLYVKAVAPYTITDIKDANGGQLTQIAQFPFDNIVKYAIPSIDKKWLKPFITNLNDFQAKFTYERNI